MNRNDTLFSGRAKEYDMYRPNYPSVLVEIVERECGISPGMRIADIGCGTGKLAEIFLKAGFRVECVEPNTHMIEMAEKRLSSYENAGLVRGYAEMTTLQDGSVNLVIAGQSFHWFDFDRTKLEFKRILAEPKYVALVWNDRDDGDTFTGEYEQFVRKYSHGYHGTGSSGVSGRAISDFFSGSCRKIELSNWQSLDYTGLVGRYLSVSYSLAPGDNKYSDMLRDLKTLFRRFARDGSVRLKYVTRVFLGQLR